MFSWWPPARQTVKPPFSAAMLKAVVQNWNLEFLWRFLRICAV